MGPDVASMEIVTAQGIIVCLRHGLDGGESVATLFVGGALGGLSGPAGGLFHRMASAHGGVRVHYRRPGEMDDCLLDVLLVHHLLVRRGIEKVILVGHSFGGAVAIAAGAILGEATAGVVALSTQVPGTEHVAKLAGRPLLLLHGDRDGILPDACSRHVFEQAAEPKELVILGGDGHLLDKRTDEVTARVDAFITQHS